jgi:hypothetical protein
VAQLLVVVGKHPGRAERDGEQSAACGARSSRAVSAPRTIVAMVSSAGSFNPYFR